MANAFKISTTDIRMFANERLISTHTPSAMGAGSNENVWWNSKYTRIYSYGLSPFYQKSITPYIGKDIAHLGKGIVTHGKFLAPFIIAGTLIVYYAKKSYKNMHRKTPVNFDDSLSIKELTHDLRG